MKKLVGILLSLFTFGAIFVGCSSSSSGNELKDNLTLKNVVEKIEEVAPMQMPMEADEEMAKNIYHLNLDDVEEYYIKSAMVMNSADNTVIVKAKDSKVDNVKKSLETRLTDVQKSFEQYLPDQKEKANKGKILTKGNYVILLINDDIKSAENAVNSCFK
ncbi:DUF4358 domain-containing protein [Clostridium septicum]|uniref:DUF4358 domain-containing protein n=1 Tax=Clostridium septicum TaxID=1504 RepID=A0A9N7PJL4_CLOSE|nr:DUF4358 domain-containing protein [Clostridium septicum]AYE32982.1 DUF4358 domain-containing protein [Clostridium septicum]QAS61150.1 DUF4358 domain-containing protein [Clostridium septicum]UEC19502.1 DUF4358 domain-containing protein [Clostridium septicum]USR99545.1 DUF4358 domain-containing protein [Clostridium septicum]